MKINDFENYDLKKDQIVKIYCHHNGNQMLFCKGKISKINKRKYKKYFERFQEKEYYKLQILLDTYDYEHDCEIAEIDSYLIADIFFN